ncbi:MAG: chemotaxis protein CheW [Treponema sp.]|jgi:chemotaxis signal transduction protein/chemotaxis methyl-accepting protein methylase|nr:chemotaxis protein CheW [Treponema sp.]
MEDSGEVQVVVKDAEEIARQKTENSLINFKMVTFSLSDKDYAIDIMNVKEIAKAGRFTYVPNALPFVLGVYNLRGEIIPILDLRLFFNIEVPERIDNKLENLLILNVEDQKYGIVVDKIDKVIGVQKSTIQPPHPLFGDINIKYINGVVESNNRLYILLDVERIFASKEAVEQETTAQMSYSNVDTSNLVKEENKAKSVQSVKKENKSENEDAISMKFISESLLSFMNFNVTSVNDEWMKKRFVEWKALKQNQNLQIQNTAEAKEYLETFWSQYSGKWWSEDYSNSVMKALPETNAKQIVVWNPGCGTGIESYSLACILKNKYPNAKIRIYAQDIDLINVSNAVLLNVPSELMNDWYAPYLTKKANGDYTFNQEIKDSIMFEYHDFKNTNALPMVDIIFARDVLSLVDEKSQEAVATDFMEKLKGNAIAIIGDNEMMPSNVNFVEKNIGTLVVFTKE